MIFGFLTYEKMLKNRLELADYFRGKGYLKGAEVGVFDGYFSEHLLKNIPQLELFAIDAWTPYKEYRDHRRYSTMNAAYEKAMERLLPLGGKIIRKFSLDAAKDFEDGSLDFVYIDANHDFDFVNADIEAWTPKVRIGGTVAGDDYYITENGRTGVIRAVDGYTRRNNYTLHITDWDTENEVVDNRQPSWFFTRTH